jgi:hypothetical protein
MRTDLWMLWSLLAATVLSCASNPSAESGSDTFTELERTEATSLLRLHPDRGRSVAESSMALMCNSAELSLDRGFGFFHAVSSELDPALERDEVRLEFFDEVPEGFHVVPGDAAADPSGMDATRIVIDARAILETAMCGRL